MLKGVNKQVLEINETQNSFFEKAIFFVKPEYCGMSEGKLRESARKEMEQAGRPPLRREPKSRKIKNSLLCITCLFFGIVMGIAISSLL